MALELSTFAEKTFLSDLTESASASTASVRTSTEDGISILDSALTLTNSVGMGVNFTFGYSVDVADLHGDQRPITCFNDYDSLTDLRNDVVSLMDAVLNWGTTTLNAVDDFEGALHAGV